MATPVQKRLSSLRWSSGVIPSLVFLRNGSDADEFIERATILGLYGGNDWDEPAETITGGGWRRRRKKLRLKKEEEKKTTKYYEDTEEKYQEGTDYLASEEKYTSPEFVEKIEKGKIEVAGVEVYLQEPIEVPKLDLAPQIKEIKDDVEKEIAQLMREKEIAEYEAKKALYVIEMRKLEEMVYFVVFALLEDD